MHPWHGETVEVLGTHGSEAVWVERENGERQILARAWTSLVPRPACRLGDGRAIRIAPAAALSLARWAATRLPPAKEKEV